MSLDEPSARIVLRNVLIVVGVALAI
ncbi:MAG: hypothetical protein QOD73_3157, partial [Solirubrobacteraceae bacterium]|nr:hypothetical protein [Solirubrobacteraceae bacterium]